MDKLKDLVNVANSLFSIGEHEKALDYYIQALKLDNSNIITLEKIGDTYFNLMLYSKALNYYEKVLEKDEENSKLINSIGYVYLTIENFHKAIQCFHKAIEISPNTQVFYKNLQIAIQRKKETFKTQSKSSISAVEYLSKADKFLKFGNNSQALLNYNKALELDPNNYELKSKINYLKEEVSEFESQNDTVGNIQFKHSGNSTKGQKQNIENSLNKLQNLVGLDNIKKEINSLIEFIKIQKIRLNKGLTNNTLTLHFVFSGPPGTGKTSVARLLGEIFKQMGILKKGHVIEADRSKLVAEYIGQTANKTQSVIDSAIDGILFIDEAYTLFPGEKNQDYGREAIDTLLKRMEDDRERLVVIVAGYPEEMNDFVESNPGLKSRFNRFLFFDDFNPDQLLQVFKLICEENNYQLTSNANEKLIKYLTYAFEIKDKSFGNARFVRNLFEEIIQTQATRITNLSEISDNDLIMFTSEDIENTVSSKFPENSETLEELRINLEKLIGLSNVKKDIDGLLKYLKIEKLRTERGLEENTISLHTVFYGSPGTGKTTVARLLGKIFNKIGILSKGHVIEVSRAELVGEYVGQTAPKTNKIIDSALGGILFIDEAYALSQKYSKDSFGQEAIDTILKRMEDNREQLIVIVAGYKNEMEQFIMSNPGLESRFNRYFYFEDYTPNELYLIYRHFCNWKGYIINNDIDKVLNNHFAKVCDKRKEGFGNARYVRNLFEKSILESSKRLAEMKEIAKNDLFEFNIKDIKNAIIELQKQTIMTNTKL